jgi:hypothetical protein
VEWVNPACPSVSADINRAWSGTAPHGAGFVPQWHPPGVVAEVDFCCPVSRSLRNDLVKEMCGTMSTFRKSFRLALRSAVLFVVAFAASMLTTAEPVAQASSLVGGSIAVAPSASAADARILEAPPGRQCGAYLELGSHLRYLHCGQSCIWIEVDKRVGDNKFMTVGANEDKFVDRFTISTHAWYVRPC